MSKLEVDARCRVDATKAIWHFVDWLYEVGPDPSTMTRSQLVATYSEYLKEEARKDDEGYAKRVAANIISLTDERMKRRTGAVTPIS